MRSEVVDRVGVAGEVLAGGHRGGVGGDGQRRGKQRDRVGAEVESPGDAVADVGLDDGSEEGNGPYEYSRKEGGSDHRGGVVG